MALVASYRFDEVGSVTRVGSVGGEPDWEVQFGPIGSATGLLGNALSLPSDFNSYKLRAIPLATLAGLRSMTISLWVYWVDGNGFNSPRLQFINSDNGDRVTVSLGDATNSPPDASTSTAELVTVTGSMATIGTWNHYLVTWDNTTGTLSFYMNNSLIDTATDAAAAFTSDFSYGIVVFDFTSALLIDQLTIYSEVVDAPTRDALYNAGAGFDPTAGGGGGGVAKPVLFHNHYINQGIL